MSKPKTQPGKFMQFCLLMQGMNAVDKNGNKVPKFLLFWHYKFKTATQVSAKFCLVDRPKNNQIL